MNDIFISYASQEMPIAEQLASALERESYSVWWDRQLSAGVSWANEIEKELDKANFVIVLWSATSVKNDWVKEEAAYARDLKKLIQVVVENVSVPRAFGALHSVALTDWNGDSSHPGFLQLVGKISNHLKYLSDLNDSQILTST